MTDGHESVAPRVAASESDMIAMARALVSPDPRAAVAMMGVTRRPRSPISVAAAALVADALRMMWPALFRRNGVRSTAALGGTRGKIWERYAPATLEYSPVTLEVLRWLVDHRSHGSQAGKLAEAPMKLGDQLVVYLAVDALDANGQARLIEQPLLRSVPLAWLGYAHLLQDVPTCSFDSLATGVGGIVVEALAPELARRWFDAALAQRKISATAKLSMIGAAQDATLTAWMDSCDRHHRRDLASFVIDAAAPVLERGLFPVLAELDPTVRIAERMAARVAAGALLRGVTRWATWDEQHRGVRFIDDDYGAAQYLLGRFERIGSAGVERARNWLAQLAALTPTRGAASDSIEGP
ncbi:MAG: hypothetical protein AB7O24_02950 [Kofleriaceae bacterium]